MKKLLLLTLLLTSFPITAKEIPSPDAMVEKDASVLVTAAFKQPNRIYIENAKVVRAVADTTLVQLDPDPSTGALYVIPLSKEQTSLFVVSDNGETHSITLSPKERITSQTIALRDKKKVLLNSELTGAAPSALPYEARVQSILRSIPALSSENAERLTGAITDGYLTGNPINAWTVLGLRLERYRLVNHSEETLAVKEPGFYTRGVVAAATEADSLPPKGSADLWIIREINR